MGNIDGKWKVQVNSPMGTQEAIWDLTTNGDAVTGTVSGQQGTTDLQNGTCDGDSVKFSLQITVPMPLKLDISATVDGDTVKGNVSTMMFGSFPLSGERVPA